MGSVSGPMAEIIRNDSRIIKERISTHRLLRIISEVEILSEDLCCRFLIREIPETIGDGGESIDNNIAVHACEYVSQLNETVVHTSS